MKHRPISRSSKGFTLIELLVVIAIIIILAAAGFGVGGSALKTAKKQVAKNDCTGLIIAIDGFYDEYQRLPGLQGATDTGDKEVETDATFMNILVGFDDGPSGENPKGLRFFDGKEAKGDSANTAVGGLLYSTTSRSVELFDPFRRDGNERNSHYFVLLDGDYDEELPDPTAPANTLYGKRALAWSTGQDDELGRNNDGDARDDVYSWK